MSMYCDNVRQQNQRIGSSAAVKYDVARAAKDLCTAQKTAYSGVVAREGGSIANDFFQH